MFLILIRRVRPSSLLMSHMGILGRFPLRVLRSTVCENGMMDVIRARPLTMRVPLGSGRGVGV